MDAEVFAEQVTGLHARLARVTFLVCGDRELAEECAQEALVRAWERVDRGASIDSLVGWTTTVALNWCRSQLRRQGAESRAIHRLPVPRHATGESPMVDHDLHAAVLALPLRQREVVVLHYFLDQDVATIASTAGISKGAVKNALFNARASLADRLGAAGDTPTTPVPTETSEDGS